MRASMHMPVHISSDLSAKLSKHANLQAWQMSAPLSKHVHLKGQLAH
jgi:hypothetical protein